MKRVYLDNAATTAMDELVLESMKPYLLNFYGNPSSVHFAGREAKAALEQARKSIAATIGAKSARLIFTSGATESNNLVFKFAKRDLGIQKVIVSPLEHHSVGYGAKYIFGDDVVEMRHLPNAEPDLGNLEQLLAQNPKSLVSIMHANNEIGTINPIKEISKLCKNYGALLHSDTVQSIAHQKIDMESLGVDFMVSSAHKYHGPKGIGFMAFSQDFKFTSDQWGGAQEKGLRAGTENVASVVGMAKALELVIENLEKTENHFKDLKTYLIGRLKEIDGIKFNGNSDNLEGVLPSVLNVSLPLEKYNEMTLFSLDLSGIAISGGSACASGAVKGSHVLSYLNNDEKNIALRISFSKYTNKEELDYLVETLKGIAP
jgi:cysteine desulfurase